ncbi:MAG: GNAT family N-acetyltransferase [Candidatus Bipolaricaulia bacterium]
MEARVSAFALHRNLMEVPFRGRGRAFVIQIRELEIDEYDRLIDLWKQAGLEYKPFGRDQRACIEREIDGTTSVLLVAEEEGRMIGVVLGTHDGRKGWINRLAVSPEFRREGVGRALVEAVEKRLESIDIGIVTCLIEEWNVESIEFFESIGYIEHRECIYYSKRMRPDI